MSPQQTERRRATRVRAELPLTLGAADARRPAILRDVSTHGLCCVYPEPIPEMTLVGIDLTMENATTPIAIEGAVVRCEPIAPESPDDGFEDGHEVAVFFTNISVEAREALEQFVDRQDVD